MHCNPALCNLAIPCINAMSFKELSQPKPSLALSTILLKLTKERIKKKWDKQAW